MDPNAIARAAERAKVRREAECQEAEAVLADALNQQDAAQERVAAALVAAVELGVPEARLRGLLGVSRATFWRRVKAARELASE